MHLLLKKLHGEALPFACLTWAIRPLCKNSILVPVSQNSHVDIKLLKTLSLKSFSIIFLRCVWISCWHSHSVWIHILSSSSPSSIIMFVIRSEHYSKIAGLSFQVFIKITQIHLFSSTCDFYPWIPSMSSFSSYIQLSKITFNYIRPSQTPFPFHYISVSLMLGLLLKKASLYI